MNSLTTHYTLDLASGLTQVLTDGTNTYLYGVGRIGEEQPGGWRYHQADALGSVRQLTDASGEVLLAKNYEPYGQVSHSVGNAATPYGYTGEWTDGYIELINLRSRMYSPATGRFLTRDSWQGDYNRPLSYNRWIYVEANPINYADPSGECPDNDGDGKCDPGWWCESFSNPELRLLCYQKAGCNTELCPPPPFGLSSETPIYRSYKRLVETPCVMKGGRLSPWWKTSGAREKEYAPVDQTMLVAILVYTEASPIRNLPNDPVTDAWIEMAGNRYAYMCANHGGCGISKDKRVLDFGLRNFLTFTPRFPDYGYETGINNLLSKPYDSPAWAYQMSKEIIKPRTWNLNRPYGVFNSQTVAEQAYFYDQYIKYGEKSIEPEGVYYWWGDVGKGEGTDDMFILTWYQQKHHRQQHPEFPIGGNLP